MALGPTFQVPTPVLPFPGQMSATQGASPASLLGPYTPTFQAPPPTPLSLLAPAPAAAPAAAAPGWMQGGMPPTGPVAAGDPNDPFGINAWALWQAMHQGGGWGGGGQGAEAGPVGGASGNQAAAGVGTADVGGVGRGF
jgi:hypothetical protein